MNAETHVTRWRSWSMRDCGTRGRANVLPIACRATRAMLDSALRDAAEVHRRNRPGGTARVEADLVPCVDGMDTTAQGLLRFLCDGDEPGSA